MQKVSLSHIQSYVDDDVSVTGWLFNKRSSGGIEFLQVRDGTGTIQAVVTKGTVSPELLKVAAGLTLESSLTLSGKVHRDDRSPTGYEIDVSDLKVIQRVTEEYPIGRKEHGVDFLLENRHLWLRTPRQWAIQRIRHRVITGLYDFLDQEGFTKIDSPIFTPNACEGTTTLFPVDYFGRQVYLSQSGQLYLEAALPSLGKVFDFGPTFRAEKSKTRRHLTEFWMMDAEMAFYDHNDNIQFQERMIDYLINRVLEESQKELEILERDTKPLNKVKVPYERMTYLEALDKLHELGSDIKPGEDLGNDDETLLTQAYEKPIFVEKYPANIKAFYMKKDPDNKKYVLCDDLLAPEGHGEIIGGSQREDEYATLLASAKRHQLPIQDFRWYLDLRKYGSVPHSGFGLGLERLVTWLCGLKHIREAIPFPRTIYRVYP